MAEMTAAVEVPHGVKERAVWFRGLLLQQPGQEFEVGGHRMWRLDDDRGLVPIMLQLCGNKLTKWECHGAGKHMTAQHWVQSHRAKTGVNTFVHMVLMLKTDKPGGPPEPPTPPAPPAPPAGIAVGSAPAPAAVIGPEELEHAGNVLLWVAGEIRQLRAENKQLLRQNEELLAQVRQLAEELVAAATASPRVPHSAAVLFSDRVAEVDQLRQQ